jgi:hypothetical protein
LLDIYQEYPDENINDILDKKLQDKSDIAKILKEKIVKHINDNFIFGETSQAIGPLLEKFFNIEQK